MNTKTTRTTRRIGIIGAMKSEMDAIKDSIENPHIDEISGIQFVRGSIHGVEVVAATCGMGKVFAGMCAQTMLLTYEPDLLIHIGVAGSLTPKLNIGDIAIASAVVQHDMDAGGLGFTRGLVPGFDDAQFRCSEADVHMLQACSQALGYTTEIGVIATGDVFLEDAARKKEIAETFQAIACEMEGGAAGQVCCANGTDFCVLRAISDNGDENAQNDFDMSLDMAAEHARQVLDRFLANVGVGQELARG